MEVLVTMALALLLLAGVIQLFEWVSSSVNNARSALEMQDRLRSTALLLQKDLAGVTVTMLPPRQPADNEGYFEYLEGPMGADPTFTGIVARDNLEVDAQTGQHPHDTTVGDADDVLMFTTRSNDRPFIGQNASDDGGRQVATVQSPVAEVAWFVRGRTLYRRQLLVLPDVHLTATLPPTKDGYRRETPGGIYFQRDLSMRVVACPGPNGALNYRVCANSLGDLTKRENRYGHTHDVFHPGRVSFPYDVRLWGTFVMPTACESTALTYWPGCPPPVDGQIVKSPSWWAGWQAGSRDFWAPEPPPDMLNPYHAHPTTPLEATEAPPSDPGPPYKEQWIFAVTHPAWFREWRPAEYDALVNYPRLVDDVVMTNVLSFDVKAWDPGAPIFEYQLPATADQGPRRVAITPEDPGYGQAAKLRLSPSSAVGVAAYGAYADLGYLPDNASWLGVPKFTLANPPGAPQPHFNNLYSWDHSDPLGREKAEAVWKCQAEPGTGSLIPVGRIYDTWSTHYDHDPALRQRVWNNYRKFYPSAALPPNLPDPHDGFDGDASSTGTARTTGNGPDHPREALFQPPYPYPLRSIRIKIRAFDASSRQVREMTVEHDFLPR